MATPQLKLLVLLLLACAASAHVHGSQGEVFHSQFPRHSNFSKLQYEREGEVVVRHLMLRRSLQRQIPLTPPIPHKSPPPAPIRPPPPNPPPGCAPVPPPIPAPLNRRPKPRHL